MKGWIFKLTSFFLTLGIGALTVWLIFEPSAPRVDELTPAPVSPAASNTQHFSPQGFQNLPDFDETEFPEPDGNLVDLLDGNVFRQSEAVAKDRERWLVLSKKRDTYALEELRASVKTLNSTSWPGDERDARVAFRNSGRSLLAFKNIAGLRPGPVRTVFFHDPKKPFDEDESARFELAYNFHEGFDLNGVEYVVRTSTGVTQNGDEAAVLVLEANGQTQIIHQMRSYPLPDPNIIGTLIWVGDIDSDGKLDLYFDEFNEKGYYRTRLFLSSIAKFGHLVGLAATFNIAGC